MDLEVPRWNVGAIMDRPSKQPELSRIGLVAKKLINKIPEIYSTVHIEKFTVMPNHVHILIGIYQTNPDGRPMDAPTIYGFGGAP